MALVIGDLHGNIAKTRAFLSYELDVEHICLGDYVDSFTEQPEKQLECLKLLIDSDAVLLWGNHDVHYLPNAPWQCTGFQPGMLCVFGDIFSAALKNDRIIAAYAVDDWLCTHAGLHPYMTDKPMTPAQAAEKLNQAFHDQLTEGRGPLFYISPGRGGNSLFGGLFWFDPFREGVEPCEQVGRQLFGHTERKEPHITERWACIDTTNSPDCWVFDTQNGKAFTLPYLIRNR